MLTEQQKESLIQAAIYAPSADNSQPFQYHWLEDDQLELWIDEARSGKASDNRYVLSDIALGAVIENVCIKSQELSMKAKVEYLPNETTEPLHVATLTLTSDNAESLLDLDLAKAIPNRCTDRRFPFKGPINDADISSMTNVVESVEGDVNWYTEKRTIKRVLPVIQKAESIRFKSKTLHQELFSTVNFNNKDAEEGMPIEVLAIEKPAQPFFKMMKNWSVMSFFNKIGGAYLLGLRSVKIPITFSPALALIKIKDNDRISVIKGGRAIQKFWLQATNCGLAIQPYAAPGIFSLGFVACEEQHKNALKEVGEEMREIVQNNGYGLMFLRIGKNSPVKDKTNRRKLDSFMK